MIEKPKLGGVEIRRLPTPVNNGMYEMAIRAFENKMPKHTHPVILRGILVKKTDKGKVFRLKCRGFECWVSFFQDTIPPFIRLDSRVTLIGDLLSANLGSKIMVVDCVAISRHAVFMDDLREVFKKHVLDINTYCTKPDHDLYFIERGK